MKLGRTDGSCPTAVHARWSDKPTDERDDMNKEQGFLLVILVLSAVISLLVLLPFLQYILAAIIFAYILYPMHERLRPHLGRRWAPMVVMTASIVAVGLPLAYITLVLFRDLVAFSRGETELNTADVETSIFELTGQNVNLTESFSTVGNELLSVLFGSVTGAVTAGVTLSIGATLSLFLVYYLLKDGARFVEWLVDVAPMTNSVCSRMLQRVDRTTKGVIIGHLFVAFVQGVVGGIGLFAAGIPNVVFWTFVMIVLALLPLFGAFLVWAPAAAYLIVFAQPAWGVFLLVYGVVVISMIDNYARPIVIDREAHLNPGIVLIGVFGGIYAIGLTGLFIGPIVLAVLAATITAFDEEFDGLGEEELVGDR